MYVLEIGWTVALFPWDILLVHMDTYHTMNSKAKFPNVRTDILLYEGILTAVKCYQRRLGLNVKENFVIGDAFVWRYLYKSIVKDIYSCLVKTSETPKCIEKWSKVLAVEIDTQKKLRQSSIKFSGLHMRNVSYGSNTNCYIISYPLAATYSSDSL